MKRSVHPQGISSRLSKLDYELLANFRHVLREFFHFSEEASRIAGVPPHQHQAMLAIAGSPGCDYITVGTLAEWLQIKHQSAVGLANRMKVKGLLIKKQSSTDKRQVLLGLTKSGKRELERLSAAHKAEIARMSPVLRKILNHLKTTT